MEGEDGDDVWSVSVSAAKAPWLKACNYPGCGQGPVQDVTEGCMAKQAAWISLAGQVVVAQPVTHGSMTSLGLVYERAESKCNPSAESLVREEAEFLSWEGRMPGPTVGCTSSEEVCMVDFVGFLKKVVTESEALPGQGWDSGRW